jgi:putative DNA-invertase from lambdoid prophage Rac
MSYDISVFVEYTTFCHRLDHMRFLYARVSSDTQSIESQKAAMGGTYDKVFADEGVSGSVLASQRAGFGQLLQQVREGDTICVYSVDRLGRDAIDIQTTVRDLIDRGVRVEVFGLGVIGKGVGELILAVLSQIAQMERDRINQRTSAGRELAKERLKTTGKTHKGKTSMGRSKAHDATAVTLWRKANGASLSQTAAKFRLSARTVSRYVREAETA